MSIIVATEHIGQWKIAIGAGEASFPMKRGSFHYKEKQKWREELSVEEMPEAKGEAAVGAEEDGIKAASEEAADRKNQGMPGVRQFILRDKRGEEQGKLCVTEQDGQSRVRMELVRRDVNRYWLTFPTGCEEHFYGCGETFSKFDLKGEKVRIWVAEHQNTNRISKKIIAEKIRGRRPEKVLDFSKYESYYVQPTFVSSAKYFVHVDGGSYMEFDFRESGSVTLHFRENAEIIFEEADSFEQLSGRLGNLLGRQRELPDWIYDGVILGMQEGTAVVEEKLKRAKAAGIRVTGVWCQDWSGCRRTGFGYQVMWNWAWDEELYPDLPEKIKEWRQEGVHFLGYINPFLAIEKELYHYAAEHGYCVKNKDGEDYLVTITTFPAAMIDFTNPAAYEWYKGLIKENLIGLGMSGWMADFGEYLPPDCVLYSGENAQLVHNRWPAIWARMNAEAVRECGKEGEIFFFTRAGYTGTIGASTMMWNGDQHVDWSMDDGLPSVIPATLSLAMSGYGITHSDAGGYTTIMHMTRGRELLMRWEEMNVFSPLLRTHEGNQPSRNAQFDSSDGLLKHLANMSRLHVALKPYLQQCVEEAAKNGIPVMRPLFYHYEETAAYKEAYEYLLGREILVAPILEAGARSRTCYLPQDEWVHLFTGKKYHGGMHEVAAPLGCPPVFVRAGSGLREEISKRVHELRGEIK